MSFIPQALINSTVLFGEIYVNYLSILQLENAVLRRLSD